MALLASPPELVHIPLPCRCPAGGARLSFPLSAVKCANGQGLPKPAPEPLQEPELSTVVVAPADTIGLDTLPAASAAAPAPLPQAAPATEATGVSAAPAQGAVETLPRPAGVIASPEPSGPKPP